MSNFFKKNKFLWVIIVIAALVRLYNMAAISLWHDEAFSALLIKYPWSEMFYRIGLDVHPPLYYIALRLWYYVFGWSLLSLRGFSVFFGIATVYAVYLFVKETFERENLALGAALLTALSPFQIQYVTEARMYTFGTFLLVMSAYFLVKAFKSNSWKFWILFAAFTSAALYTHYYEFFSEFALGLFGLIYIYRKYRLDLKAYGRFFAAYLLVFLSYVPWLKTFWFQFHQVQNNYWIPAPNHWSVPVTNWLMLTGGSADAAKTRTDILLVLACLFTLYMIYRVAKQEVSQYKWLVLFGLVVPFLGSLALSYKQSIYLDRYFLFADLFYNIAILIFLFSLKTRLLRYVLLFILLAVNFANYTNFWKQNDVATHPGMGAAAAFLNNNVGKEDQLYVASSFEFFNFKYYNQTGVAPLLYTPGIQHVSDLPHYSGTAILTDQDLIHSWSARTSPGDLVWVLWTTGFGGQRPNDIPQNWALVQEKSWDEIRPYLGTQIFVDEYLVDKPFTNPFTAAK